MTSHVSSAPSTDGRRPDRIADAVVGRKRECRVVADRPQHQADHGVRNRVEPDPLPFGRATSDPTTWWATRNGTPRRTSASATAVAVV